MDCFTMAVTDNRNKPKNIFFNLEVNTVAVANILKEREGEKGLHGN